MAEAFWLVRRNQAAVAALFRGFAENLWALAPLGSESLPELEAILKRYQNIGVQLADACLVHLAGREGIDTIFTLDRRDFSVYRFQRNRRLKIIPAPSH
jgi:predicted nucleic acid-binding protein